MAVALKKVKLNPLNEAAMLVCLSTHGWGNRIVAKEEANKTADTHQAQHGMFFTTKKLVPKEAISDVTTAFARFKVFHYENTLPWLDNGYRILPATNYLPYVAAARELKEKAMTAVDKFLTVYPSVRDLAKKRLGTAFRETDYPSSAALKRRWAIEINFVPLPDKNDFRADIPAKELLAISQNIDEQVQHALANAQTDLFQRLYDVVAAMRDKVAGYRVVDGKGGKRKVEKAFRDSAISNIRELCELLPKLNFTNDPALTRLTAEVMKDFGNQDPEALREDELLRSTAVSKANAILKKMSAYIGEG
jgi:hypothetical protein